MALPYYAGLTSHRQNGYLANLKVGGFVFPWEPGVWWSDYRMKTVWVAILLLEMWACFLIATVALMIIPAWTNNIRHHADGK